MEDEALARLVANDLVAHLTGRSDSLTGPVYAVALWSDVEYGVICVSIATETAFARRASAPHYVKRPDELLGINGVRWTSGDWETIEPFVSPATESALRPLAWPADLDELRSLDDTTRCATARRWEMLGYRVVALADPLSVLNATPLAIAYAEEPDLDALEKGHAMLHNVPPARMNEIFPEWGQMAAEVRAVRADEQRMHALRTLATVNYPDGYPPADEPPPDPFTALLRLCGLTWQSVLTGSHELQQALELADMINPKSDAAPAGPLRARHDHL